MPRTNHIRSKALAAVTSLAVSAFILTMAIAPAIPAATGGTMI